MVLTNFLWFVVISGLPLLFSNVFILRFRGPWVGVTKFLPISGTISSLVSLFRESASKNFIICSSPAVNYDVYRPVFEITRHIAYHQIPNRYIAVVNKYNSIYPYKALVIFNVLSCILKLSIMN